MKRLMEFEETLIYYDMPNLIVAKDQIGLRYICQLVETTQTIDKFLCIPLSAQRLKEFKSSNIDLQSLFENPEVSEYYLAEIINGKIDQFEIGMVPRDQIPDAWIPDPGFYFYEEFSTDNHVVQEAKTRDRGISFWRLSPPESADDLRISATHLSEGLRIIQKTIKYAYIKYLSFLNEKARSAITIHDYSLQEVIGFSNGSFTIQLQSAFPADLVGYAQVSKAYEIIDEISRNVEDTSTAINSLTKYGGHFVSSYRELLQFINDNNIPIEYEWSMPSKDHSVHSFLYPRKVRPLLEALNQKLELSKEYREFTGYFTKVDEKNNTWRITNEKDAREYSGESEIDLAGLIIHSQLYSIHCEEILEVRRGTGKETPKLILKSFAPL